MWQLAVSFSHGVADLDARKGHKLPRKLREQLLDAAASVSSNIAEGYARRRPRQFLQFVDYSRGSLAEAETRLRIAVVNRAFTAADIEPLLLLAKRFAVASWRLRQYLATHEPA